MMNMTEPTGNDKPKRNNTGVIWGCLIAAFLIGGTIWGMFSVNQETSVRIKDIMVVLLTFEIAVISVALVILAVQAAKLIMLLQIETKPILSAAKDTMYNVRGTVSFLSDNVVEPAIRVNSTVSGVSKIISLLFLRRGKRS